MTYSPAIASLVSALRARRARLPPDIVELLDAAISEDAPAPSRAPRKMGAEEFSKAWGAAAAAVSAVRKNWHLDPTLGVWATWTGPRTYKTPRGTTLRFPRDLRAPAARFWPGGEIPAGLVLSPPARLDRSPITQLDRFQWNYRPRMCGDDPQLAADYAKHLSGLSQGEG